MKVPSDGHVNNFLHGSDMSMGPMLSNCKVKYSLGLLEEWFHICMERYPPLPHLVYSRNPSSELWSWKITTNYKQSKLQKKATALEN